MRAPMTSPWPAGLVATLMLLVLASACIETPRPQLSVSPEALTLDLARTGSISVANVGDAGSTLRFAVTSEASWLLIEPSEGSLEAGHSSTVTVRIRSGEVPAEGSQAAVLVTTNAGSVRVRIQVGEFLGATICARDAGLLPTDASRLGPGSDGGGWQTEPALAPAAGAAGDRAAHQVLVLYHPHVVRAATPVGRAALTSELVARSGARLVRTGIGSQHDLLVLPEHAAASARAALERDPRVAAVVPNLPVHRSSVPNDPSYAAQWWAWCFGVDAAWHVSSGAISGDGDDVVIAVVDDGFNLEHNDLAPKLLPGYDLAEGNDDVRTSLSPHGTHVAGIALAVGDNGTAIAGVAYGAAVRLLPVKVFPDDVSRNGTLDALINGMRWSVGLPVSGAPANPNPADVVNLSLGVGSFPTEAMKTLFQATVAEMRSRGAVVVAAAGNRGTGTGVEYPARSSDVIGVGSVDWTGVRSVFSTYGPGLDLMAPGGSAAPSADTTCLHVLSLGPVGETATACLAGTSMASPFVSGTAALLIANDPARYRGRPEAIEARLLATTLSTASMNASEYGAGIACPDAALGAASRCGWPGSE